MDILKLDMIPIPDDTLEAIAGGGIWNCDDDCGDDCKYKVPLPRQIDTSTR